MIRRSLLLLLLAIPRLPAPEPDIGDFFERFTAEWVRADPQLATNIQYFSGTEQDKLDRQLTPQTDQFRKERVELARRGLAELRRFDLKRLSSSQFVSARVLDWQLDTIAQGDRYEGHRYVFHQMGMPAVLVRFADVPPIIAGAFALMLAGLDIGEVHRHARTARRDCRAGRPA